MNNKFKIIVLGGSTILAIYSNYVTLSIVYYYRSVITIVSIIVMYIYAS